MQVNQVQDHVSHAILGGDESIAYGMSDSAEFFAILYKTLYSDQILAVVRETMCNGWDAHIESGRTNIPLDITLTQNELIIRDYGKGIPRKLIGPIYGVMGGTTKVENDEVTGGFGLGCKSPFAYGDHFGVSSWSEEDGLMTVYSMSKSNAEKKGKPGITPIVSLPITDGQSGIEVKIQIKPNDFNRFRDLILRIAANGEMLVKLNGAQLPVLPFDGAKHGFMVTKAKVVDTNQYLLLRYGNVIYPIDRAQEFGSNYDKITSIIQGISTSRYYNNGESWKIIFQAKPNTIAVTPSRETLSMQEHTIKTISELLQDFVNLYETTRPSAVKDILREQIHYMAGKGQFKELLDFHKKIPGLDTDPYNKVIRPTYVMEPVGLVQQHLINHYPQDSGFFDRDIELRLEALSKSPAVKRELVQSFKAAYQSKPVTVGPNLPVDQWFKAEIVKPLIKELKKEPEMSEEKLFIYGPTGSNSWNSMNGMVPIKKVPKRSTMLGYLGFIRNTVILAFNRSDVLNRTPGFPYVKASHGALEDTLVYLVSRSTKKVKAAQDFFAAQGMMVLDLTVAQPWEDQEAAAPEERVVYKAKRKGLPALSSVFKPGPHGIGGIIETVKAQAEDCPTIDNPAFVIKISAKNELNTLPDITHTTSVQILKRWGHLGGVVINVNQEEKYLGMGAATFKDFILTKVRDEYKTNPRIRASLAFDISRSELVSPKYSGNEHLRSLMRAIYADPDLSEYLGITWNMTPEDKVYVTMWEEFRNHGYVGSKALGLEPEINKLIKAIPLDPVVDNLYRQLQSAPLLRMFKATEVESILKQTPLTEVDKKRRILCRDMLLQAIEG